MIEKSDVNNKEDILDKILSRIYDKKLVFNFYTDWDTLLFWKPMNWRNFTFIYLYFEWNDYKYFEFDIALLGFHFGIDWYRNQ